MKCPRGRTAMHGDCVPGYARVIPSRSPSGGESSGFDSHRGQSTRGDDLAGVGKVPLTFGSLFAGIGGFDLGFERAGMVCKWQVEIDEYARKVLAKHWPHVRRWDDVRTFPPGDGEWGVDVICGGDPCQANSRAAMPRGGSRKESFGGEFIRVVEALRPRIVVRENPARVRREAPWPWWRFRNELERCGYVVLPFRVRACCVGADHQRDRLFLLAENPHANGKPVQFQRRSSSVGAAAKSEGEARKQRVRIDAQSVAFGSSLHADGNGLQGIDREGEQTEHFVGTASNGGRAEQWNYDLSSPRICRSRNGIPQYVDRIRGLGNAVVPQVAEWIGRRIVEATRANT